MTSFKKPTDPDVLARALGAEMEHIVCVVLETGRMANWLYDELSQRGLPMVCIDALQAHAVLSQMHNKTYENDAAMLSELARTGFYKKIEVKSQPPRTGTSRSVARPRGRHQDAHEHGKHDTRITGQFWDQIAQAPTNL
ncbi:hypothetical protein N8306_04225 [Yoonia sp.]|nr:hypothetical protein [Yoonia sp.]